MKNKNRQTVFIQLKLFFVASYNSGAMEITVTVAIGVGPLSAKQAVSEMTILQVPTLSFCSDFSQIIGTNIAVFISKYCKFHI